MTATTTQPAPGERVIPGDRIRAARHWATLRAPHLQTFDCAGRVLAVVAHLITDPDDDDVPGPDLADALRDVDTVDLALDLLTDAGVGCGG